MPLPLKHIVALSTESSAVLALVVNDCAAYFLLAERTSPAVEAVLNELFDELDLPVDWRAGRDVYLVMQDDRAVGMVDIVRGRKAQTQSMIGLLLIKESFQDHAWSLGCTHWWEQKRRRRRHVIHCASTSTSPAPTRFASGAAGVTVTSGRVRQSRVT